MSFFPASSLAERIAWAFLIFVLGAFLLGTWFNRRRGKSLGYWIDAGLKGLGGLTTWTFIKSVSSGAVGTAVNTRAPFRAVEAGYYLLTREIPPLYGIELLRGKRDLFSIKADLSKPPAAEYDVVPLGGALAKELDKNAGDQLYTWVPLSEGLGLATRDPKAQQIAARVRPFTEKYGKSLQRLSVRGRSPNVLLFLHLQGLEDHPSSEVFNALRRMV